MLIEDYFQQIQLLIESSEIVQIFNIARDKIASATYGKSKQAWLETFLERVFEKSYLFALGRKIAAVTLVNSFWPASWGF